MIQRFEIPGKLVSLNDYTKECRKGVIRLRNGKAYCPADEMKKEQQAMVAAAIRAARLKPFDGHVKIVFEWYEPDLRRDLDNVRFAAKFILDALVDCGILKGDGQRYVQKLADVYGLDRTNPRIVVELEGD